MNPRKEAVCSLSTITKLTALLDLFRNSPSVNLPQYQFQQENSRYPILRQVRPEQNPGLNVFEKASEKTEEAKSLDTAISSEDDDGYESSDSQKSTNYLIRKNRIG